MSDLVITGYYITSDLAAKSLRGRTQPHNNRKAVIILFNNSNANYILQWA